MNERNKKMVMIVGVILLIVLNILIYSGIIKKSFELKHGVEVLEINKEDVVDKTSGEKDINKGKENKDKEDLPSDKSEVLTTFTNYEEENYNKGKQGKSISVHSTVVKDLYDMVEVNFIPELYPDFMSYNESHFYMDKLVRYETLSDEARLYYAYQMVSNKQRRWFKSCDELAGYTYNGKDVVQLCLDTDSEMIKKDFSSEEWFFNDVNKKKIEEAYHKMYGNDKKVPLKSFTMSVTGTCLYSSEKDDFVCFKQTGSDSSSNKVVTKIEKALEYGDSIEIYDRYIWFEKKEAGDFENYLLSYYRSRLNKGELIESKKVKYANSEEEDRALENVDDKVLKKGALYKHTFIKDNKGKYHWYSSVRVKE